ncbi:hypothetical protein [Fluviicola sp.]|uniref:hypothetical protein n=1 Tax=Fluviicola sp. TaxID=1917219 RepID=UPI00262DAF27|nr:hypothetical protein [Fluviicola sp.]
MKHFFTLVCALSGFASIAQTPLISHKSHSGNAASFLIAANSNFGRINIDLEQKLTQNPVTQQNFIPLNDTIMLHEISDLNQNVIQVDTLPNKNRYSTMIFQMKYQDSIQKTTIQQETIQPEQQETPIQPVQTELNQTPVKKKKKSYLLFLFGITGGGMLLMKLFGRSQNINQSIA